MPSATVAALAEDVASLAAAFERERVSRAHESTELSFRLGGLPVRMEVVGRRLGAWLTRPFAHLSETRGAARPASLTIDLWEEDGSRAPLRRQEAGLGESGRVRSSPDGRYVVHERPHGVAVLDRVGGRLVGWLDPHAEGFPAAERATPLKLLLSIWCGDRGIQLVHAALVAKGGHGVLMPGPNGAGKSTTAAACATSGYDFLGDDCVGLGVDPSGAFVGWSLYNSTTLHTDVIGRLRALPEPERHAGHERAKPLFSFATTAARLGRATPIRLVALPRVVRGARPGVRRATKAEALLRLAPTSLVSRAVPADEALRRLSLLVSSVPSYWLDVDLELEEIPRRLDRLLEGHVP